jgi:hypothetical protein
VPRYNVATGIPDEVVPLGRLVLRYSRHALKEAAKDRHAAIKFGLPGDILAHKARLVEVETDEHGALVKAVYRCGVTKDLDAVLVVSPRKDRWVVRTCWGNLKSDAHRTLDKSKYTPWPPAPAAVPAVTTALVPLAA